MLCNLNTLYLFVLKDSSCSILFSFLLFLKKGLDITTGILLIMRSLNIIYVHVKMSRRVIFLPLKNMLKMPLCLAMYNELYSRKRNTQTYIFEKL